MAVCCNSICLNWREVSGPKPLSAMRKVCVFNPRVSANEYPFLIGCNGTGNSGK